MLGQLNFYSKLSIIWASAILVLLVISPGDAVPNEVRLIGGIDKFIHFLLFAVLYFLSAKAAEKSSLNVSKWTILTGVCMYSLLTEVIQLFLKDRFFEFHDIIANIMGALGAFLFYNRK